MRSTRTRRNHSRFDSDIPLIDMLMTMLLIFAALFILSFLNQRPNVKPEKSGIELKAEFMLTMTWPNIREK